jgi:diguanylate cyclase (GGDEF)-like protein/PAS domain S-box-containing protein
LDIQTGSEIDMKKPVKSIKSETSKPAELRRQAEKIAREKANRSPKKHESFSPEETLRILHELQVHQIELEMQNEEMSRTQAELNAARARYFNLYDLAPVGYVTVSDHGLIMETNLTAATLFNLARERLVGQLLTRFILKEDQDIYYLHRKQLLDTGEPQMCELRMVKKGGTVFWAHLAGAVAKAEDGTTACRVVMSDITKRKQAEEALHESEEKHRLIFEYSPLGILSFDEKGAIIACNDNFVQIIGSSREKLIGLNMLNLPDKNIVSVVLQALNGSQGLYEGVYSSVTAKKNTPVRGLFAPINVGGGRITGGVGIFEDITERKRAEEVLTETHLLLEQTLKFTEALLSAIPTPVFYKDKEGRYQGCNRAFSEIMGVTLEEMKGKTVYELWPSEQARTYHNKDLELMSNPARQVYEFEVRDKDGVDRPVIYVKDVFRDKNDQVAGIVGAFLDITDRKKAESQREALLEALRDSEKRYLELSIIDDLTQLYNSRHFYAQLAREIERSNRYGQPLTLLLLDLDKFKDFNDTYGHVQGDYVLSRLGHAIKRSMRETDSAYRYGGEEFTIILPMTISEEGIVTAKRIQKEFRKENFSLVLGQEVYMTVSIGLAQYKPKEEIRAFVHRVDQFMYKVKKNGRGKICSDDGDIQ